MKDIQIKVICGQIIRQANAITASGVPLDNRSEEQLDEALNHLNGTNQIITHLVYYLNAKKEHYINEATVVVLQPEDRVNDNVRRGGTDHWPLTQVEPLSAHIEKGIQDIDPVTQS
jgi:hypothetical protein